MIKLKNNYRHNARMICKATGALFTQCGKSYVDERGITRVRLQNTAGNVIVQQNIKWYKILPKHVIVGYDMLNHPAKDPVILRSLRTAKDWAKAHTKVCIYVGSMVVWKSVDPITA